jgi:hypothetical protein
VGTEIFRSIDPNIWIKVFKNQVLKYDKVACPDVRMPNERRLIKELGGVLVLIKRPKYEARDHASESDMGVEDEYDVIVNNNMKKTGVEQEFRFWYEYVYSDGDPR